MEQQAGFEAQLRELKAAGCERVFREQVSSVARREQLDAAVNYAREGDVLVVTKLDRLARSMADLMGLLGQLRANGAGLRILDLGLDTTSATGELILNVIGSIAQFERQMMLERQREGIAKAKGEGKYKGREPTARVKADEVRRLHEAGTTPTAIAVDLKCPRGVPQGAVEILGHLSHNAHEPSGTGESPWSSDMGQGLMGRHLPRSS